MNIIELLHTVPEIHWSLLIPQYFFFTGISAAAFLLSALTYVFGWEDLRPIAKLSLIVAFTVLVAAPLNLIADLAQPGRFYSMFYRQHVTSPMSWGVYLLTSYLLLMLIEALFVFRSGFALWAQQATGTRRRIFNVLALGTPEITPETVERDKRWSFILGSIGIAVVIGVEVYTGYILGVVRARPLWHTSLMPILFLVSAMVSGIAFMILLTWLLVRTTEGRVPWGLVDKLAIWLGWAIVTDMVIRFFWYTIGMFYSYGSYRDVTTYLFRYHFTDTVLFELTLGLLIPAIIMLVPALRRIRPLVLIAAFVTVVGVWLFRWDTVIGGQEIPKTGAGFYHYTVPLWGNNGLLALISNWAFWLFLFLIFIWVLPWQDYGANLSTDTNVPDTYAAQTGGAQ